jgi:mRNA interferase MazF
VIVQDDRFSETKSVTVCGLTTDPTDAPLLRLAIAPSEGTGLHAPSRIMVDKITTLPRTRLGRRLGRLTDADVVRLNRALVVFLGIAARRSGED